MVVEVCVAGVVDGLTSLEVLLEGLLGLTLYWEVKPGRELVLNPVEIFSTGVCVGGDNSSEATSLSVDGSRSLGIQLFGVREFDSCCCV